MIPKAQVAETDDDFTEARDAQVSRMDGVRKSANGTGWFFAKASAAGGLLGADLVRELVGGSDESEAAMLAKAAYEALVKERYSAEDRRRMADDGQALQDGSYPIADAEDLDNAIHAVGRGKTPHDTIRAHIIRRAKALGQGAKVPDAWGSKGSMKKAGDGQGDAGSPAWEGADATSAQTAITAAASLHGQIKALMAREATEVGAGHVDDIADVLDLAGAADALVCVLSTLAGFAAREQLEAGPAGAIAKGGATDPDPAHAVHDTMGALAQACNCPPCQGFLAAAKAHDCAPRPPADATDGPAAATTQGTPPTTPTEQTMTTPDANAAGTTPTSPAAPAEDKQSKKAKKLAKSAAIEALAEQLAPVVTLLTSQNELLTKQQGQIDELSKGLEAVKAQPVPSGLMHNGAVPGAGTPAPVHRGTVPAVPAAPGQTGQSAQFAEMRKAAEEETNPRRRKTLATQAVLKGLDDVFSQRPTVRP